MKRIIFILVAFLCLCPQVWAAETAWVVPTSAANVAIDSKTDWSSPNYALADDASYSTCLNIPASDYGDYLQLKGYDFSSVPAGSTLTGIAVKVKGNAFTVGNVIKDYHLYLIHDSGGSPVQVGDDGASASYWSGTDTEMTHGGDGNTWNCGLTADQIIADTNFGIQLSVQNTDGATARTARVTVVWIKLYYTAPGITWNDNAVTEWNDNAVTVWNDN